MYELFLMLVMFFVCLFAPSCLARRGVASRRVWLGAGVAGLLAVAIYPIGYYEYIRLSSPSNPEGSAKISFQGTPVDSSMLPFGEDHIYCFAVAFGLILAGPFYKPKRNEPNIISVKVDRSVPNA